MPDQVPARKQRVIALRLVSKLDPQGRPRIGWLLFDESARRIGFALEGPDGPAALERVAQATGAAVFEIGPIKVPVTEYNQARLLPRY